jgi:BirA family biotin operon repressor/biotin-[acetyl-CoA-carboxylase] ligase
VTQLDPVAAAAGVRLVVHATLGSTNAEALALARAGERGPLWIVAKTQTAGRGRRGRTWVSEPGNLYASLLLSDAASPPNIAQLSFVGALAVHDAVAEMAAQAGARLTLKWPNDILCEDKKVCGVLLEGEGADVAVGIGVNCANHPHGAEFPATNLAAFGIAASPEHIFQLLSRAMVMRLNQWSRGAGFSATRVDWLKRASGLGQAIRVRLHDRELAGIFEALDERGHLLLRRADGALENIAAGDVFPIHSLPEHA